MRECTFFIVVIFIYTPFIWAFSSCESIEKVFAGLPQAKFECENLQERLIRTKDTRPETCENMLSPANERSFPGSSWDQRKCFSSLILEDFKKTQTDFLTARTSKLHRDGQEYRSIETEKFFEAAKENCTSKTTLYEAYACIENEGRKLIRDAGKLNESWGNLASKDSEVSFKKMCETLNVIDLSDKAIAFITTRAEGQRAIPGYPAYQECRKVDLKNLMSACEKSNQNKKLSSQQWNCLQGAVRGISENVEDYDRFSKVHGYQYLLSHLAGLRRKALMVTIFSRMCTDGMRDKDSAINCLTDEISELTELKTKADSALSLELEREDCDELNSHPLQTILELATNSQIIADRAMANRTPAMNVDISSLPAPAENEKMDEMALELLKDKAQKGLSGDKSIDLAEFMLKADQAFFKSRSGDKKEEAKLLALLEKGRKILGPGPHSKEDVLRARSAIYDESIRHYRGGYPDIRNFFTKDDEGRVGGNCVAVTKVMLALLKDDPRVHVQVFDNHIQPVRSNEDGSITNLQSGEEIENRRAPIFDKKVMYWGYLNALDEEWQTPPKILLKAGDYRGEKEIKIVKRGSFIFPQSDYHYDGEVPAYADSGPLVEIIKNKKQLEIKDITTLPSIYRKAGFKVTDKRDTDWYINKEISAEDLVENVVEYSINPMDLPYTVSGEEIHFYQDEDQIKFNALATAQEKKQHLDNIKLRVFLNSNIAGLHPLYTSSKNGVFFRNPQHQKKFRTLKTPEERKNYLAEVRLRAFYDFIQSNRFKNVVRLVSMAEYTSDLPEEVQREINAFVIYIHGTLLKKLNINADRAKEVSPELNTFIKKLMQNHEKSALDGRDYLKEYDFEATIRKDLQLKELSSLLGIHVQDPIKNSVIEFFKKNVANFTEGRPDGNTINRLFMIGYSQTDDFQVFHSVVDYDRLQRIEELAIAHKENRELIYNFDDYILRNMNIPDLVSINTKNKDIIKNDNVYRGFRKRAIERLIQRVYQSDERIGTTNENLVLKFCSSLKDESEFMSEKITNARKKYCKPQGIK